VLRSIVVALDATAASATAQQLALRLAEQQASYAIDLFVKHGELLNACPCTVFVRR
jgi:hypothetical protein